MYTNPNQRKRGMRGDITQILTRGKQGVVRTSIFRHNASSVASPTSLSTVEPPQNTNKDQDRKIHKNCHQIFVNLRLSHFNFLLQADITEIIFASNVTSSQTCLHFADDQNGHLQKSKYLNKSKERRVIKKSKRLKIRSVFMWVKEKGRRLISK